MSVVALITDPKHGLKASVDNNADQMPNALVVATRPYDNLTNSLLFFSSEVYGYDMNYDFSTAGGTPDNVHNGTDNTYWTASAIVGGANWIFDSTDYYHTGTKSIDASNTNGSDVAQFAKGSSVTNTDFNNLSGWIYIQSWPTAKDFEFFLWNTGTSSQIGNRVGVGSYVNTTSYNVWQKFVIPITEFGSLGSSFDALRVIAIGKTDCYFDDIKFNTVAEGNQGATQYIVKPELNTWLYTKSINVTMVDAYDSTRINGTTLSIPYNSFLGVSPDVGLVYQRVQYGKTVFSTATKGIIDIIQRPGGRIDAASYDGTYTMVKVSNMFSYPILLKYENDDRMTMTLSDDYSGLNVLRVSVGGMSLHRTDRSIY